MLWAVVLSYVTLCYVMLTIQLGIQRGRLCCVTLCFIVMLCYFVLITRPALESDIARAGVRFDAFLSERADPLGVGPWGRKKRTRGDGWSV